MWFFKKHPGIKNRNLEKYDSVHKLLWIKCANCGKLVYYKDYKDNLRVCPECGHIFGLNPKQRFDLLFDDINYQQLDLPIVSDDPLEFEDLQPYTKRLAEARKETGHNDALSIAIGNIGGIKSVVAVMNIEFMGGSMGRAVGEGIIYGIETAIKNKYPFIIVSASGGARMQENVLSLMQMARTTVAVNMLNEAGLPYIVILTDPTFGGTTASFAMLGDIHIAESGARIGFAGRRVIEQNLHEKLPKDFQTAEYLYSHGMIDIVTTRSELKDTLVKVLQPMMKHKIKPEIKKIETPKSHHQLKEIINNNAFDKIILARNENRPHFFDYINGLFDNFVQLAGDRLFGEDLALIGGIGYFEGNPVIIIGQEKGRTIDERLKHRFGAPNPEGYRKAQRLMRLAEKLQIPVISLVDTAGAFAGRESEERGQAESIAKTIQTGLSIKTPYISIIVGEGGSGGAIAIATADKVLMMENAIYSVIAPESCASIIWKDNKYKADAATAMKLTANDLLSQGVIDGIIMEPNGGAHKDWATTMDLLKESIRNNLQELQKQSGEELKRNRAQKYLKMTRF